MTSVACGIRTAEMRWSNHDRLSSYNIRLVGWPNSIPQQNPSAMTMKQNMSLLEALANGTMRFQRTDVSEGTFAAPTVDTNVPLPGAPSDDISWAYQDDDPGMPFHDVGTLMRPFLWLTSAYDGKGR